ncbi:hypothetical protein NIES4102_05600 [Chondrocystis sp. NIES-4102]|nr:hypothetical protein NIES4102_05600 [Chondrocystis sp. NIES-4102]
MITASEVAIIIFMLQNRQLILTPAGYPSILAGVHGKMTIESDNYGLEGVG